jgi:replicative DNA helicase
MTERIPGADAEALSIERALIGGCLVDTRGCREWPSLLPSYFYLLKHEWIWQAMLDLTEVSEHPDLLMLAQELHRTDRLVDVGGTAYLVALVEEGTCAVDLRRYGALVRRGAAERDRQRLAGELLAHPEGSEEVEAILRSLEEQPGQPAALASLFTRLEAGSTAAIETGLEAIDSRLGGVKVGQLTVIAGRTSHAKTALVCDLAKRFARGDHSVDFITLEDPAEAIAARLIAGDGGRSVRFVREGRLAGLDAERLALELLPITVTSVPGCKESAVIGAVAASRAEVVIIDHLQQIGLDGADDESRNYVLERIMGRLAAVARRDGKAVILTAQLNREMERTKREPTLADIRDSGAVEQAARVVLLVYWRSKHDPHADPADYLVKIEKNSEGATGRASLKWNAATGRFWDPTEEARDW